MTSLQVAKRLRAQHVVVACLERMRGTYRSRLEELCRVSPSAIEGPRQPLSAVYASTSSSAHSSPKWLCAELPAATLLSLVTEAPPRGGIPWMLLSALTSALMATVVFGLKSSLHWSVIAFGRTALGALFAFAALRLARQTPVWKGEPALWVRSAAGAIGVPLAFYAVSELPTADALVLMQTGPLWLLILTSILFRHRPDAREQVLIAVAITGIVVLQRPQFSTVGLAAAAALANGLLRGVVLLAISRFRTTSAQASVLHSALLSLTTTGGLAVFAGLALHAPPAGVTQWVALVAVGLLGCTTQIFGTRAMLIGPARKVSVVLYSTVGFGALLDWFVWDIQMGVGRAVGMGLILLPSVFLSVSRRSRTLEAVFELEQLRTSAIPPSQRSNLEHLIEAVEHRADVELRIHIDPKSSTPALPRAHAVFKELEMNKTASRNAVLLLADIEAGRLVIVADVGIEARLAERDLCTLLSDLDATTPLAVIEQAVERLSTRLEQESPRRGNAPNELPNEVTVGLD